MSPLGRHNRDEGLEPSSVDGRARRRRRVAAALAVLLGALLLVAATRLRWPAPGPAGGPPEAQPRAPVAQLPAAPALAGSTAAAALPQASLYIHVRGVAKSDLLYRSPVPVYGVALPLPGDDGWPPDAFVSYQTQAELRALESPVGRERKAAALVETARAEGFLGDAPATDTPELALTSLYARWAEMDLRLHDAWAAYQLKYLGEGAEVSALTPEELAEYKSHDDRPQPQLETAELEALADDVTARWPDHPIAEHAALARIRVEFIHLLANGSEPSDSPAASDNVLALLDELDSPALRVQAAILITCTSGGKFQPTEALITRLAALPIDDPKIALVANAWLVHRAIRGKHWALAAELSARQRAAVDVACAGPEPYHGYVCDYRRAEIRDTVGRLIALGYAAPATWQEEVIGFAWRCHLETPHRGVSKATATWTGAEWVVGEWDAPTEATACIDRIGAPRLVPDAPLRLQLTLEGPPPPKVSGSNP